VPLTVGQEWSGWAHQIRDALRRIRAFEAGLFELAAGGTAVGTGLNAPSHFSREIAEKIAELTGYPCSPRWPARCRAAWCARTRISRRPVLPSCNTPSRLNFLGRSMTDYIKI
jgi:hypothetical protein